MRARRLSCYVEGPLRKLKYIVPNGFTTFSLCLGLASLTRSAQGDFELAAWMILWGVLLDKLDGSAARLLGASSAFGAQLDSFADFVVFGLAPAGLAYYQIAALGELEGTFAVAAIAAAGIYVLAAAARLARFNISEPPMGDRIFYGLPTTLMGGIMAAAYLTSAKYGLVEALVRFYPVGLLAGALLMVSNVRLAKLKVRRSKAFNVFQYANVLAAYVLAPLRLLPEYLLGVATCYAVVGVGWYLVFPPGEAVPEQDPSRMAT